MSVILWIGVTAGMAAEVNVEWAIPARLNARLHGTHGRVFTPSRPLRRPVSVTTEEGGYRLTCAGEGRLVRIDLAIDTVVTDEHPRELVCTVGPDRYVLDVRLDLEVAYRQADHATLRGAGVGVMARFARPDAVDERAVVLDAAGEVESGFTCRIEAEMLAVDVVAPIDVGVYRCFFADGRVEFVEVLPSHPIR